MSSLQSAFNKLTGWLVAHRTAGLLMACLLTLLAIPFSRDLRFDQTVEAFFAPDHPRLAEFRSSRETFGGDELVLLVWQDEELFDEQKDQFRPERLKIIQEMSAQLAEVPGILPHSIQDLPTIVGRAQGMSRKHGPGGMEQRARELARDLVLGDDNFTSAIVARMVPLELAPVSRDETIRSIREMCESFQRRTGLEPLVVGEPVRVVDMSEYVEQDVSQLGFWSAIVLGGLFLILFRSPGWALAAVSSIWAAVIWTAGLVVPLGGQMSLFSAIVASLVNVVGGAALIHLFTRFQVLRRQFPGPEAVSLAVFQMGPPAFWTCLTTAIGCGVLLSSQIPPVTAFGRVTALGVMLVLPAIGLILPGVVLFGGKSSDPRPLPGEAWLGRALQGLARWVLERSGLVWGMLGVIVLACGWGCSKLRVEPDFNHIFRSNSPLLHSLDYVETHLGGGGTWELNFAAPTELDEAYVGRVRDLAKRLRELPNPATNQPFLSKVLAYSDGIDLVPKVPILIPNFAAQNRTLLKFQPEFVSNLYNPDKGRMRLLLRSRERQAEEQKLALIEQVEAVAREVFPDEPESVATGRHVLFASLTDSLLQDLWSSLGLAVFGIVVIMVVAQRSVRMGLVAVVPSLLVVGGLLAVLSWRQVPIHVGTATMASVALGLTIDSSIYYLAGFRRELSAGLNFAAALQRTHAEVGTALLTANLVILAGLLVLAASNFIPLADFGLYCGVASLGGVVANLVMMPELLRFAGGLAATSATPQVSTDPEPHEDVVDNA